MSAETPAVGTAVTMIRPHLRDLPVAPFPAGYGIRPLDRDEGHVWLDIVRDAEELARLGDDAFERNYADGLDQIPERCVVVTGPGGQDVGTISAWFYTWRGEAYGLVHWVAVRRAHQGRGIGRAMMSVVLERLARWHDRALLNTDVRRLPALKLYLDTGFLPVLDAENGTARWRLVREALAHPVLASLPL